MKRLAIFVFYDSEGIVDRYVPKMLSDIREYADRLIVVCNGRVNQEGNSILDAISDEVITRENKGYDVGAYKDVISLLRQRGEYYNYDEMMLCNDTFFGFFFPLREFFDKVKGEPEIDFWGMTKAPKGYFPPGNEIMPHVQAYFMLINSRMMHSRIFLDFWDQIEYPANYVEAVLNYEVRFTTYFEQHGYKSKAYVSLKDVGIEEKIGVSPYMHYTSQLIIKGRLPILKLKPIMENGLEAIQYLQENGLYDVGLIWDTVLRKNKNHAGCRDYNLYELEEFCKHYKKVYIYGAGKYGKIVKKYLDFRGFSTISFVVTKKDDPNQENIIEWMEIEIDPEVGVILAVDERNTEELYPMLIKRIAPVQVCTRIRE